MNTPAQSAGTPGDMVGAHGSGAAAGKRKRSDAQPAQHESAQRNKTKQHGSGAAAGKRKRSDAQPAQHESSAQRNKTKQHSKAQANTRVFDPVLCDDWDITEFPPFLEEI